MLSVIASINMVQQRADGILVWALPRSTQPWTLSEFLGSNVELSVGLCVSSKERHAVLGCWSLVAQRLATSAGRSGVTLMVWILVGSLEIGLIFPFHQICPVQKVVDTVTPRARVQHAAVSTPNKSMQDSIECSGGSVSINPARDAHARVDECRMMA